MTVQPNPCRSLAGVVDLVGEATELNRSPDLVEKGRGQSGFLRQSQQWSVNTGR